MMITGITSTVLGAVQTYVGLSGGSMENIPGTYTGMMLSAGGPTASTVGDIAEAVATGAVNPSALGVTHTALQITDAIDPFGGDGTPKPSKPPEPTQPPGPGDGGGGDKKGS